MKALDAGDKAGLIFKTVVDQFTLGLICEDEEAQEPTDRAYWENRGTVETVKMADQLLEIAKKHDPDLELKYNKFYIGIVKKGVPNNFITSGLKKSLFDSSHALRIQLKHKSSLNLLDLMLWIMIVGGDDTGSGFSR